MRYRNAIMTVAAVSAAGLLATGCTSGTETATDRGWVGGEPQWTSDETGESGAYAEADTAEAAGRPGDAAASEIAPEAMTQATGLRAGSVDDNADYQGFLDYLARLESSGISTRPFSPEGRIVVSVKGSDGLPVPGAEVAVSAGDDDVATVRTTADGTARFWPGLYETQAKSYTFTVDGSSTEAAPGGEAVLEVGDAGGREGPLALDVMFLIDATGSMGDEIEQLKTTVDTVASRIAELDGSPQARFGMTLYRDEGDTFVTSTYDLTGDLPAFRKALADVQADGGGDYPEALDEGLAAALGEPSWGDPADTLQLVFLIADAPPQVGRQVEKAYPQSISDAIGRGIKVFPIASSESDDQAEAVFRQVAAATGSRFVFLSYGAAGAATGANSDIASTDYEELSLDELVVRLVAEELAALTGSEVPVPPTSSPPTTPPDQ